MFRLFVTTQALQLLFQCSTVRNHLSVCLSVCACRHPTHIVPALVAECLFTGLPPSYNSIALKKLEMAPITQFLAPDWDGFCFCFRYANLTLNIALLSSVKQIETSYFVDYTFNLQPWEISKNSRYI